MRIELLGVDAAQRLQHLRGLVDAEGTLGPPPDRKRALTIEEIQSQLCAPSVTYGTWEQDELVGSAAVCRMPECIFDSTATQWFGVAAVIVHPLCRRQGIAQRLLHKCIDHAAEHHAIGMLLDVFDPNPARVLYERLGFEEWHKSEGVYHHLGQKMDKVSMRKWLRRP